MKNKIVIGNSDYSREEMESGLAEGGWGTDTDEYLRRIKYYENTGRIVKFETSLFRRLFGIGKYRVVSYQK